MDDKKAVLVRFDICQFAVINEILSGNYDTEKAGIEFADNR